MHFPEFPPAYFNKLLGTKHAVRAAFPLPRAAAWPPWRLVVEAATFSVSRAPCRPRFPVHEQVSPVLWDAEGILHITLFSHPAMHSTPTRLQVPAGQYRVCLLD